MHKIQESEDTEDKKKGIHDSEKHDSLIDVQSQVSSVACRFYLLIENPSKRNNLGPFLRCASAFGVETFVFVGYPTCSSHGSHGADKHVKTVAFPSFSQAITFLRNPAEAGGCGIQSVIGCMGTYGGDDAFQSSCRVAEKDNKLVPCNELQCKNQVSDDSSKYSPPSYPVHLRPFRNGSVCFLISKSSFGLPKEQASLCDFFVHIPIRPSICNTDQERQHGLLDAQTSLSIILHHWTSWASYNVRTFSGQKFHVETIQKGRDSFIEKRTQRNIVKLSQIEVLDDTLSAESWCALFGKDDS